MVLVELSYRPSCGRLVTVPMQPLISLPRIGKSIDLSSELRTELEIALVSKNIDQNEPVPIYIYTVIFMNREPPSNLSTTLGSGHVEH